MRACSLLAVPVAVVDNFEKNENVGVGRAIRLLLRGEEGVEGAGRRGGWRGCLGRFRVNAA